MERSPQDEDENEDCRQLHVCWVHLWDIYTCRNVDGKEGGFENWGTGSGAAAIGRAFWAKDELLLKDYLRQPKYLNQKKFKVLLTTNET